MVFNITSSQNMEEEMPEAPEVQTIVNGLKSVIVNTTVTNVIFSENTEDIIDGNSKKEFLDLVEHYKVLEVVRRGKYIDIFVDSGIHIVIHLLMTGQLIYKNNQDEDSRPKYLRVVIQFDDGSELCLADKSTWVKLATIMDNNVKDDSRFTKLGVDVFSEDFTENAFKEVLSSRRAIHSRLLDQKAISGLGNIYVNEVLYYSGIHPKRQSKSLNNSEAQALYFAIYYVVREALKHRGTTFSDYRTPDGSTGQYQNFLRVYQRAGQPCFRCGTILEKIKVSGRGAVFCPHDQPEYPGKSQNNIRDGNAKQYSFDIHNNENFIFIITGPSSVGKTTLSRQMAKHIPFLKLVPTVKTRNKRPGEIEGVDSIFVSKDTFEKMQQNGDFLIFGQHFNHWYGTQRRLLENTLISGNDVVIIVSPEGAKEIKAQYDNSFIICLITSSEDQLSKRIYERNDYSVSDKKKRESYKKGELDQSSYCDHVITTINELQTLHEAFKYVYKIRCATY
ncbi:MAG: DNA-formamidopyrimidine glycosylase [Chitinivibrionales bacterium]|nr:DNA-formamidopyrimidine glycosylase [Chitinivibrionales bacterium]